MSRGHSHPQENNHDDQKQVYSTTRSLSVAQVCRWLSVWIPCYMPSSLLSSHPLTTPLQPASPQYVGQLLWQMEVTAQLDSPLTTISPYNGPHWPLRPHTQKAVVDCWHCGQSAPRGQKVQRDASPIDAVSPEVRPHWSRLIKRPHYIQVHHREEVPKIIECHKPIAIKRELCTHE